jgi:hypothetical protein
MKNFYIFCFMMWGMFGLIGASAAGLYAPILTAIYAALMWLAGCVLFGFAVLMTEAANSSGLAGNEVYLDQ